ncbi:hypothetical protein V6N12_069390 [Hibiscus sabdariffa]|uniref:Nodulin homeobox N-terminal domain-containing protein n=1 Tax=Hibiscus sabdariffa TaxID=183260 RepID=A0ABR2FDR6_9ROSI
MEGTTRGSCEAGYGDLISWPGQTNSSHRKSSNDEYFKLTLKDFDDEAEGFQSNERPCKLTQRNVRLWFQGRHVTSDLRLFEFESEFLLFYKDNMEDAWKNAGNVPWKFFNMKQGEGEAMCTVEQAIDLISVVKEIHGLNSQELNKLLRDSGNFTIHFATEKGLEVKIDVEKLAGFLPLHLIAVLVSSGRDEALLRYLLCGIRLLNSLCELAPRHTKFEQDINDSGPVPVLHSALVACSLYLLTGCISSQWQDLALVMVAHPKVDMFMDVACRAIHQVIRFLQSKLLSQHTDICAKSSPTESMVNYLCQQCEASLQFLQLLCQQKPFRERLLKNKELCGKGGILFLAQSILKLHAPDFVESSTIMAALSRLKAKVLSILLHLCEAESISYLDEVAGSPGSLDLAKSVAFEILELLKSGLSKNPKHLSSSSDRTYPMGLLQLNAMRLADIFSDDSNF